jgi:hypothetical protein
MAIVFEQTNYAGKLPVFYQEKAEVLPGDYALKQTFPDGTLIERGTPVQIDFDNMEAGIVKVAVVVAGGTTTKPRVRKGSLLLVGDVVMKIGKADASPSISSIDKSNASYDEITLSAALATLAEGDFLQECTAFVPAAGEVPAVDAAPLYIPDAVVAEHKEIQSKKGFPTVAAACAAKVLKGHIYPIPGSWLEGYSLKNNHSIKYIKQ